MRVQVFIDVKFHNSGGSNLPEETTGKYYTLNIYPVDKPKPEDSGTKAEVGSASISVNETVNCISSDVSRLGGSIGQFTSTLMAPCMCQFSSRLRAKGPT